jgi:AmpE protein
MKFIILLICLGLQIFLHINFKKNKYRWLDRYLTAMKPLLAKLNIHQSTLAFIALLVPVLIVILILNGILSMVGLFYFIYAIIILMLCFDIRHLKKQLEGYFTGVSHDNLVQAQGEAEIFVGHPVLQDKGEMSRAVTETILTTSLTNIFSVIFWFMLLGPFGAVLYYVTAGIAWHAQKPEFGLSDTAHSAECFKEILDWLPVRLLTLTFALIGHFAPVIGVWLDKVGGGLFDNRILLIDAGLVAIHADLKTHQGTVEENQQAIHLINRTLSTWVIIIGILTVVTWL